MKLAKSHRTRLTAVLIVYTAALLSFLCVPGTASATFTIDGFNAFICPEETVADPGTKCTGNTATAGAHRAATVSFDFGGDEKVHTILQHYPVGIIPNPENVAKCPDAMISQTPPTCPPTSKIGTTTLVIDAFDPLLGVPLLTNYALQGTVYNLEVAPPFVGGLGFVTEAIQIPLIGGVPLAALKAPFTVRTGESIQSFLTNTLLNGDLDTGETDVNGLGDYASGMVTPHDSDNGLTGLSANIPEEVEGIPIKIKHIDYTLDGINTNAADTTNFGKPYITLSTGCLSGKASVEASSHDSPTVKVGGTNSNGSNFSAPGVTNGCTADKPPFTPEIPEPGLSTDQSDTPSAYDIKVGGLDDIHPPATPPDERLHESDIRRAKVTLPEGTALSPSAANGLVGCTDAQLGAGNNENPSCPAASDIGDIEVTTRNLPASAQPTGNVYLGEPTAQDTYRLFLAFKIVDGLWVKQKGVAKPDPVTGQITTTFDKLPALPFVETTLHMEKPDGTPVLVNPPGCGSHTVTSVLTSFKFPGLGFPETVPDSAKTPSRSFDINGCLTPKPFAPSGTLTTDPVQAGANTKLNMNLTAPDREQLLKTLRVALPPGLIGRLGGVPQCSVTNAASGQCAEDSKIGTVNVAVGAGPDPLPLPGKVYLADPIASGDPASLSVVVPSKVGPFDFGPIVTRVRVILRGDDAGLDIALADDLPPIVGGVPIRVRTIGATVDRENFITNPTSCKELASKASYFSREGAETASASPFQATNCDALGFSPELKLELGGEMQRFGHPSLKATVTQPAGQANIARALTLLPDLLRPETVLLNKPGVLCQPGIGDVRQCPESSKVGTATAVTPALPTALTGPVYIIQAPGNPLPRLAVQLGGIVNYRLDALNSIQGIRTLNDFSSVPDIPITRFELNIAGGLQKGILKNFTDACKATDASRTAEATFTGQNGKTSAGKPKLALPVCVAASKAPKVTVKLKKVRSGKPTLKITARRASELANLKSLSMKLPRGLKAVPTKLRKGGVVKAKKLKRGSAWKLSKSGKLTVSKLPKAGSKSITVTLNRGAIVPNTALASKVNKRKKPRLTFKVKVTNVAGKSFTVKRKLRAR